MAAPILERLSSFIPLIITDDRVKCLNDIEYSKWRDLVNNIVTKAFITSETWKVKYDSKINAVSVDCLTPLGARTFEV